VEKLCPQFYRYLPTDNETQLERFLCISLFFINGEQQTANIRQTLNIKVITDEVGCNILLIGHIPQKFRQKFRDPDQQQN